MRRSRSFMAVRAPAVVAVTAFLALAAAVAVYSPGDRGARRNPVYDAPLSDAMASLHFLHAQRAYPQEDIPATSYMRAYERVAAEIALARTGRGNRAGYEDPDPWSPLGPLNVGGRTNSIAINPLDPDIIYAGAASGGLWRTNSGGRGAGAWSYIETGFPVLGVNAIAIDPSDTARVYIGTGEVYGKNSSIGGLYIRTTRGSYGIGILRTTDGGATWEKSLDWTYDQRRGVLSLDLDPHDPNTIFAGTSEGVYRSTDGGDNWSQVLALEMIVDMAINPVDSDTIFASCGNLSIPADAGIYRSFDGGDTWTELTSGLPSTWTGKTLLDLFESSPNVVYADVANALSDEDPAGVGLYRSIDSGDTWEWLSAGYPGYHDIASYQGWYSHFVAVHPTDSSKVVASGVYSYRSDDGGRTFTIESHTNWYGGTTPIGGPEGDVNYSHADNHAFARHPTDPNTILFATDGGIYESNDFGRTFSSRNGSYQTTQFYGGFASSPTNPDLALGGLQDNSTVVYHGGLAWQRTLGGDGGFCGLFPLEPTTLLGSTQYGRIYKTYNGGNTWNDANMIMWGEGDVAFVAPFAQAPSNMDIIYAGRTNVWRSDNGGEIWYVPEWGPELDGNPVLSISVYPGNPDYVWAATAPSVYRAGVYRTVDGGETWENVTRNLPDRYPVDIATGYTSSELAYVVFSGFGTPHLYRTDNGGDTWVDISTGLPDIPTSAFVIDPFERDHLYLGNDFGVWFSPDNGENWYEFTEGMPTGALVMDLSISHSDKKIRAVTHGLGVWERPLVEPEDPGSVPDVEKVELLQNYPNPFNGNTLITYTIPEVTVVDLDLYNVRGQHVKNLVHGIVHPGIHYVTLNSANLPSGIYIYRLKAGYEIRSRRLMIIK